MTKKEWFARLRSFISGLPQEEQKRIFDYYDELYADKRETGMSEWDIIAEFGNPQEVAGKMLAEMSSLHANDTPAPVPNFRAEPRPAQPRPQSQPEYRQPEPQPEYRQLNYQQNPYQQQAPNQQTAYQQQPVYQQANQQQSVYPQQPVSNAQSEQRRFSFGRLLVFILVLIPCAIVVVSVIAALWAAFLALTVSGVAIAVGGAGASIYTLVTNFTPTFWIVHAGFGIACVGVGIAITTICSRLVSGFVKLTGRFFKSMKNFLFRRVKA